MTPRAIIISILMVVAIASGTYFNDAVLRQNFLIGNFLPVIVFGPSILFILAVNPLLRRFGCALLGRELAFIAAVSLVACAVPGTNLMRKFTPLLMMPHQLNQTEPGWQERDLLERIPAQLLADPSVENGKALDGFIQGLATGREHISPGEVPWSAWLPALGHWVPIILVFWIGLLALGLILHRQWSEHEKVSYPIATFFNALLGRGEYHQTSERHASTYRGFWIAGFTVVLIHLSNYIYAWNSGWVEIPLEFDFSALLDRYPLLVEGSGQAGLITRPHLYFSVIAIGFILSREVSFSMGIGPYLYALVATALVGLGAPVHSAGIKTNLFAPGAGFALMAMVLFTGWHYYTSVFRAAVFLPGQYTVRGVEVGAARVFIVTQAGFIALLVLSGVDWFLALLLWAAFITTFVVMSRALAESGLFYMQTQWTPTVFILALLGFKAVGPNQAALLLFIGLVLHASPRAALMPFVMNGLKIMELRRVPLARGTMAMGGAVVIALIVAIPVTLYWQYDQGINAADLWAIEGVPRAPFQLSQQVESVLLSRGETGDSGQLSGLDRLLHIEPSRQAVVSFGIGFGLFLGCALLRLRIAGWPIHPLMFIFWNTPHLSMFAFSFLLGWAAKYAITRYGGEGGYLRLKPIALGLFAGEMVGALIPVAIGWAYYFAGGQIPPAYHILPYF